jgi:hypothetical protein
MNRPLRRKLENLVMKYLDTNKTGTAFESVSIVSSGGTTLADEAALDAGTSVGDTEEPSTPFIAVAVSTSADPHLPGVAQIEIVIHLKTDGTAEDKNRLQADTIIRDLYNEMIRTLDDDTAFSDSNIEFSKIMAFANLPTVAAEDARQDYRRPLHIYDIWHTDAPSVNDGEFWHDQLIFAGTAQDMDSHA